MPNNPYDVRNHHTWHRRTSHVASTNITRGISKHHVWHLNPALPALPKPQHSIIEKGGTFFSQMLLTGKSLYRPGWRAGERRIQTFSLPAAHDGNSKERRSAQPPEQDTYHACGRCHNGKPLLTSPRRRDLSTTLPDSKWEIVKIKKGINIIRYSDGRTINVKR